MKRRKCHYSTKLKKSVELERKIQSLKDQTTNELYELGDQIFELENQMFTQALLLGALTLIVLALIIWQIISHITL